MARSAPPPAATTAPASAEELRALYLRIVDLIQGLSTAEACALLGTVIGRLLFGLADIGGDAAAGAAARAIDTASDGTIAMLKGAGIGDDAGRQPPPRPH